MQAMLVGVFGWLASNLLGRILAGAGLALAGAYTFGQFIEYFINRALGSLSSIPMSGLIGVAGIDTAISIILSAYMIRLYLHQLTATIGIVKGGKK